MYIKLLEVLLQCKYFNVCISILPFLRILINILNVWEDSFSFCWSARNLLRCLNLTVHWASEYCNEVKKDFLNVWELILHVCTRCFFKWSIYKQVSKLHLENRVQKEWYLDNYDKHNYICILYFAILAFNVAGSNH